jgi:hypothetical protein
MHASRQSGAHPRTLRPVGRARTHAHKKARAHVRTQARVYMHARVQIALLGSHRGVRSRRARVCAWGRRGGGGAHVQPPRRYRPLTAWRGVHVGWMRARAPAVAVHTSAQSVRAHESLVRCGPRQPCRAVQRSRSATRGAPPARRAMVGPTKARARARPLSPTGHTEMCRTHSLTRPAATGTR